MTLRSSLIAAILALCVPGWSSAQPAHSLDVPTLVQRAEAGDPDAQFHLANRYESGRGVERNGTEAIRWYLAAAQQGNAEAQNSLGSIRQAQKKFEEAGEWFTKASNQGHALATNNLAYLHDLGLGYPQNRQEAHRLYLLSANRGWAEAMWNLSNMFGAGQLGAPPDLLQACIWTFRSERFARQNDSALQAELRRIRPYLRRTLSSDEMSKCQEEAKAWEPNELKRAEAGQRSGG